MGKRYARTRSNRSCCFCQILWRYCRLFAWTGRLNNYYQIFMEIFAERLRELRDERNLSQRMLSNETGIPQSSIALWESGTRIPAATAVVTLAKYFGVSTDFLLGLED